MKFRISAEDAELSLLRVIKTVVRAPSVKAIKRAIEARSCKVNGRVERFASRRLSQGDVVEFTWEGEETRIQETPPATVLYEDEDFLAIDKPAGVVSTLQNISKCFGIPQRRIFLVHRLDKDTTGVLLLAKREEVKKILEELFASRKVEKKYLALVHGWLHKNAIDLSSSLVKQSSYAGQTIYRSVQHEMGSIRGEKGRAITRFTLLKKGKAAALVQCEPVTGRTHQLRAQLSALGSPIIGDLQYGKRQEHPSIHRQMLHAWKVALPHPRSSKTVEITAPLPLDFEDAQHLFLD